MEWLLAIAIAVVLLPLAWWVGRLTERSALAPTLRELERKGSGAEAESVQLRVRLDEAKERAEYLDQKFHEVDTGRVRAETRNAELERSTADQVSLLDDAKKKLSDAFQALAAQALRNNTEGFLTLAEEKFKGLSKDADTDLGTRQKAIEGLITPVTESLEKLDKQVRELEEKRAEAYGGLLKEVELLHLTEKQVQQETGNLVKALRQPTVAGRWGEMQLRRVVELAEMVEHCDFVEQEGARFEDGLLRPDMLINLPGGKLVVVDAKCPVQAYLDAVSATTEEERASKLRQHAQQVRGHIQRLSAKAYWDQFQSTPAFVILFLPGENLFRAALENDPNLIDAAIAQRVVPASPTTLISHLRAIHYGWQQERIAESAEQISRLGRTLHDRIAVFSVHVIGLRQHLDKSVESFNEVVASLEGRVLPLARRFKVLGADSDKQIAVVPGIDRTTRALRSLDSESLVDIDSEGPDVEGPMLADSLDEGPSEQAQGNEPADPTDLVLRICVTCGNEFSQPRRQGRPFERCAACRTVTHTQPFDIVSKPERESPEQHRGPLVPEGT